MIAEQASYLCAQLCTQPCLCQFAAAKRWTLDAKPSSCSAVLNLLCLGCRYLLRLGMGEQELATEMDFSRVGRVNAMLARRLELLAEVGLPNCFLSRLTATCMLSAAP